MSISISICIIHAGIRQKTSLWDQHITQWRWFPLFFLSGFVQQGHLWGYNGMNRDIIGTYVI